MALENDFISGLDPTPLGVISASQLLQMVQQAVPESNRGLIYFSTTVPDIANNPWLVRYIWLDPSVYPIVPKIFNATFASWDPLLMAPLSVTTSMLVDGAVTPAKISHGAAYQLLRTDPTGLNVEWWTLQFAANSIDVVSLASGAGSLPGDFLRISLDGSTKEWFTFSISDYLTINSIPISAIAPDGFPGDVIAVNPAGVLYFVPVLDLIADGALPISKLTPGAANTFLTTDSGGNRNWVPLPFTNIHGRVVLTTASVSPYTVPAGVYTLDVEVVGGGGGGLSVSSGGNCGGSGGGYCRKSLTVTPGQLINFVVGAGGPLGNPGQDGQDSNFDTIIANGGLKGSAGPTVIGGTYSGGDYGAMGKSGGSTFPNPSEFTAGTPTIVNMAFCGGSSGYPLSVGGQVTTVPTLGGGGPSASPNGVGTTACNPQNGADGLIILTF